MSKEVRRRMFRLKNKQGSVLVETTGAVEFIAGELHTDEPTLVWDDLNPRAGIQMHPRGVQIPILGRQVTCKWVQGMSPELQRLQRMRDPKRVMN